MDQMIAIILSILVTTLPQIIVATVGLVLVRSRLKGFHPRAYFYGNIGLALLLANSLSRVLGQAYFQTQIAQGQDRMAVTTVLSIANFVGFVLFTASLVFILVALLADRESGNGSRSAA